MTTKNTREFLKATAPKLEFFVCVIAVVLFWILLPATFLIGAVWSHYYGH